MESNEQMLLAAMKKATELKMWPKDQPIEMYLKNWEDMAEVLDAALKEV